jgi:hypothetical protein
MTMTMTMTTATATAIPHVHAPEPAGLGLPPASSASVALDIGPGRGALVIYPDERYRGQEIEISPAAGDGHGDGRRVHTGVHERPTMVGSTLTAIFGSLPDGEYVVWTDAETAGPTITVAEGAVTELRLS